MAERDSSTPNWPCPQCGYNLVGLIPTQEMVRCPECGCITDHRTIHRTRHERERNKHEVTMMVATIAAVIVAVFVVRTLLVGPVDFMMLVVAIVVGGIVLLFFWTRGFPLGATGSMVFLLGLATLLLLPYDGYNRLLMCLWIGAFLIIGFLREWRRIGDRY